MKYWICLKFMFYFHLKWALTFKTISHSYMRCDNTIGLYRLRKKKEKLVLLTIIVLHTSLTHVWCPASFDKNLKAYKNMAWELLVLTLSRGDKNEEKCIKMSIYQNSSFRWIAVGRDNVCDIQKALKTLLVVYVLVLSGEYLWWQLSLLIPYCN